MNNLRKIFALLTLCWFPAVAFGGHDTVRTIEFLGFSADASRYLLLIRDERMGTFFSLRSFESGKQLKAVPVENPQDEMKIRGETIRREGIVDPGKESTASPDGNYTIVGVQRGNRFDIKVMRGNRFANFQTLKVEEGSSGPAKVQLKSVYWSKDGRRIVVILHKELRDENSINADEAWPFRFFASTLNFQ